jgi:hypothetical protein
LIGKYLKIIGKSLSKYAQYVRKEYRTASIVKNSNSSMKMIANLGLELEDYALSELFMHRIGHVPYIDHDGMMQLDEVIVDE